MIEIKASLVKELRKRTGAGVMDCKKALIEANGEIEVAIDNMHKFGTIKAFKKLSNITANGAILTKIDGNHGIILEVNCETDFVAKSVNFLDFANKVLNEAISKKDIDINTLKDRSEGDRIALVTKVGENIDVRRIGVLHGDMLGSYQHFFRIGVLVSVRENTDEKVIKQLAMHIASNKPSFIRPEDISSEIIKEEYQIHLNIAMQSGKSKETAKKVAEGYVKKFFERESLVSQLFVINPSKTVAQFLEEQNTDVFGFIRFEVGERVEKNNINSVIKTASISEDF